MALRISDLILPPVAGLHRRAGGWPIDDGSLDCEAVIALALRLASELDAERPALPAAVIPFAKTSERIKRTREAREEADAGPVPVICYSRLSRNRDGTTTGLERQRDETSAWAPLRGYRIVAYEQDDDTSAFSLGKPRHGFERSMRILKRGQTEAGEPVRGVIGWKLDRIVRRVVEWSVVLPNSEKTPWFVASFKEGVDTRDSFGRLIAQILVAMAELESTNISVRSRSKHTELAREGKWSGGGTRAYGHNADRTAIIEEEADNLRALAERLIRGEGLRVITRDFAARGIVGPKGTPITAPSWRRMLLSPRIIGRRATDDGTLSERAQMPSILDADTAVRVWAILDRPSGSTGFGTARRHLLSGLLECWACNSRLKAWMQHGEAAYACLKTERDGCGRTAVKAEPIEAVVTEVVLRVLERQGLADYGREGDRDADRLFAAIEQEQAALEDLARDRYDRRKITDAEFTAARGPIMARLEELRGRLAKRAPLPQLGPDPRAAWPNLTFAERRAAVGTVVEKIIVGPGFTELAPTEDGIASRRRRLRPDERLTIVLRRH